jgi:hypothetical protein
MLTVKNNEKIIRFTDDLLVVHLIFTLYHACCFIGWFMVLNATFNNISIILWQSVLLVEETGVSGENHRPVASN